MKRRYFLLIFMLLFPTFVNADVLQCDDGVLGTDITCTYNANNIGYIYMTADVTFTDEGLSIVGSEDNKISLVLTIGTGRFTVHVSDAIDLETTDHVKMTLSNIVFNEMTPADEEVSVMIALKAATEEPVDPGTDPDNPVDPGTDPDNPVDPDPVIPGGDEPDPVDPGKEEPVNPEPSNPEPNDPSSIIDNIINNSSNENEFKNPSTGVVPALMIFFIMAVAFGISHFYYSKIDKNNINK